MKYRKKPTIIEAVQLKDDDYSILQVLKFIGEVKETDMNNPSVQDIVDNYIGKIKQMGLAINSSKGIAFCRIGDYIIKDINGNYYPCDSNVFNELYEAIK